MSFDGPCSVLRSGMHGFPFDAREDSRTTAVDQIHLQQPCHLGGAYPHDRFQQQQHQQHQQQLQRPQRQYQHQYQYQHQHQQHHHAAPSVIQCESGPLRRIDVDKSDGIHRSPPGRMPSSGMVCAAPVAATAAVNATDRFTGLAGNDGWGDSLPGELGPALRTVSSLVLSNEDEDSQALPVLSTTISGSRPSSRHVSENPPANSSSTSSPTPALPSSWSGNSAIDVALKEFDRQMSGLRQPTASGELDIITREQTYPPPDDMYPLAGRPTISRQPTFPPSHTPPLSFDIMTDWPHSRMPNAGNRGIFTQESSRDTRFSFAAETVRGVHERSPRAGAEERSGTNSFSRAGAGDDLKREPESRGHGNGLWNAVVDGGNALDNSVVNGDPQEPLLLPSRRRHAARGPSFDTLAAMIPSVPQDMQSPSSSPLSSSTLDSKNSTAGTTFETNSLSTSSSILSDQKMSSRGRQPGRHAAKTKRSRDDACGARVPGRTVKKTPGSKLASAPGSCGPRLDGEPEDKAKQQRREAAISRYLHKRRRRRFANSIRDASPSRSRPKAARIRPRLHGKFVKTVPDFVSVTKVAQQGGPDMKKAARALAAGRRGLSSEKDRAERSPLENATKGVVVGNELGGPPIKFTQHGGGLGLSAVDAAVPADSAGLYWPSSSSL